MGLLEISGADLGRWDLRRNRKHGQARAVAVEQAVDEVQIAGAATARANGEFARQVAECLWSYATKLLQRLSLASTRTRLARDSVRA